MIEAYLDESGIHDGAEVCLIAGFFAGPGQWRKFEVAWRKALRTSHLPLQEFHALNLLRRHKYFHNWSSARRSMLINDLTDAITAFKIYPVSFGLVLADFHALSEPQKQFFTGATINGSPPRLVTNGCASKPYFMPFLQCVRRIAEYAPEGGKANFHFGLDRPFANYAKEMFKMISRRKDKPHGERVGEAAFPLAKETPQLQAADFFTYLTYVYMIEKNKTQDWEKEWPPHH